MRAPRVPVGADAARRVLAPPPLPGRAAPRHDAPGRAPLPAGRPARSPPRGRGDRVDRRPARRAARGGRPPGQRGRRDDRARPPARAGAAARGAAPAGAVGPPLAGAAPPLLGELRPGARRGVAAPAGAGGAARRRDRPRVHPAPARRPTSSASSSGSSASASWSTWASSPSTRASTTCSPRGPRSMAAVPDAHLLLIGHPNVERYRARAAELRPRGLGHADRPHRLRGDARLPRPRRRRR